MYLMPFFTMLISWILFVHQVLHWHMFSKNNKTTYLLYNKPKSIFNIIYTRI